jgi:hypothetical protein
MPFALIQIHFRQIRFHRKKPSKER